VDAADHEHWHEIGPTSTPSIASLSTSRIPCGSASGGPSSLLGYPVQDMLHGVSVGQPKLLAARDGTPIAVLEPE